MNKLIKILIAIVIILSVCGNLYWIGNQELEKQKQKYRDIGIEQGKEEALKESEEKKQEYLIEGINQAVLAIYNQVKENGEITLRISDKEEIILIKK